MLKEEKDEEQKNKADKTEKLDKKGFDNNERLTLKINVREAEQYDAQKDKKKNGKSVKNIKKLPKKIRNQYEEDEDEDDGIMDEDVIRLLRELHINQSEASNGDTTLIDSLSDNERRQIMQSNNIEITRHEQNAGKQNALEQADTKLRQAGLTKMTSAEFAREMQGAIYNPSKLRRDSLADNITKKTGIEGRIEKNNETNVVVGVKKVMEVTDKRKVKSLKMDDVKNIGQKNLDQNKTAELILQKSGQTARLSEIKRQSIIPKPENKKENKKSYESKMKDLLKESLKKNDKVR